MKNQLIDESALKDNQPMSFEELREIFIYKDFDDIKNLNIDYNITSGNGTTPLMLAAEYGCTDIIKYLVEEHNADTDATSDNGATALTIAAKHGHHEAISYLVLYCHTGEISEEELESGSPALTKRLEEIKILQSSHEAIDLINGTPVQTDFPIDLDVFISVYKNEILKKGFKDNLSEHLQTIKDNLRDYPEALDKIEDLLKEAKTDFLFKCSDLFTAIEGEHISPAPLSELILQKQQEGFPNECNDYTSNLIGFYAEKGTVFSVNVKDFLLGKIADEDGKIAESLQQEIYVANIKIIQDNIEQFLFSNAQTYELIIDLIHTTLLPESLREYLDAETKAYKALEENPLAHTMHEIIDTLAAETTEQDAEIQYLKLLLDQQGIEHHFELEETLLMGVDVNDSIGLE